MKQPSSMKNILKPRLSAKADFSQVNEKVNDKPDNNNLNVNKSAFKKKSILKPTTTIVEEEEEFKQMEEKNEEIKESEKNNLVEEPKKVKIKGAKEVKIQIIEPTNEKIHQKTPANRSEKKKTFLRAQSFVHKDEIKNKLKEKTKDLDEPIQLTKFVLPKIEKKKNRIVGTPDYMAPEVLRGEGLANPVLDWWSVGLTLINFKFLYYFLFL